MFGRRGHRTLALHAARSGPKCLFVTAQGGLSCGYRPAGHFVHDLPSGDANSREKIDGLEDALRVIRGLWTEPAYSYEGRVHRTEAAPVEPKPAHRIPIWLGTFGDRALVATGRQADGWIPSLGHAPLTNCRSCAQRS
ncbi:MAG: LLM class flavin-dependent oxidoreductase [Acidimicrobiales bacterium]